jgi:serpin B
MTIFLPQEGKTLDDLLAALNGKNWNTAYYQDYEVHLSIPRIETDTNQNLEDIMSSLGMKNAFLNDNGHGFLDLCYFGDNEANSDACWISIMRQKAHLKLDEKGTEAAAATVIGAVDKAMPPSVSFTADKPFLYIISDYFTGSIFFIGQYMGEVTTGIDENVKIKELKNESIYNLQGQRINFLQKGLNIVDGKKVWVK